MTEDITPKRKPQRKNAKKVSEETEKIDYAKIPDDLFFKDELTDESDDTKNTEDAEVKRDITPLAEESVREPHQDKKLKRVVAMKAKESKFSPQETKYKLIAGKHNYEHLSNVDDNGEIYIRRYTTIEENLFKELIASFSIKKFFEIINKTFETTVRSVIDTDKLSMIEQFGLFFAIYDLTYGKVDASITCQDCDYNAPVKIDLKTIKRKYMKPNQSLTRDVDLNTYDNKYKIILNYPTLEDQLIYLDDTVEWEQKIMLLVDKIYDDSGSEVDEKSYLDLIVNLNVDDKIAIREALEEVSTFAVDFNMKKGFTCENKSCKSYHKKQDYEIPMEVFFENIFKNFI